MSELLEKLKILKNVDTEVYYNTNHHIEKVIAARTHTCIHYKGEGTMQTCTLYCFVATNGNYPRCYVSIPKCHLFFENGSRFRSYICHGGVKAYYSKEELGTFIKHKLVDEIPDNHTIVYWTYDELSDFSNTLPINMFQNRKMDDASFGKKWTVRELLIETDHFCNRFKSYCNNDFWTKLRNEEHEKEINDALGELIEEDCPF